MKFSLAFATGLTASALCASTLAAPAPTFQSNYVAPTVDVAGPGVFAKTDQRLFNYAGETGYFAGVYIVQHFL